MTPGASDASEALLSPSCAATGSADIATIAIARTLAPTLAAME